jgi:hypothetical protein
VINRYGCSSDFVILTGGWQSGIGRIWAGRRWSNPALKACDRLRRGSGCRQRSRVSGIHAVAGHANKAIAASPQFVQVVALRAMSPPASPRTDSFRTSRSTATALTRSE